MKEHKQRKNLTKLIGERNNIRWHKLNSNVERKPESSKLQMLISKGNFETNKNIINFWKKKKGEILSK